MAHSDVFELALRLVVPLRHEFGKNVNVEALLHDSSYARQVISLALTSHDERLLAHAASLERAIFGPRTGPGAAPARAAAAASDSQTLDAEVQAMRARYKTSLR
jgi:hypothetical protein